MYGVVFKTVAFVYRLRHKFIVVKRNALKHGSVLLKMLRQKIGRDYLVPVVKGMSPKGGVPCLVEVLYRAVAFFQPCAEGALAVFAVAGSAVFVGNMPCDDIVIVLVALRQF